MPVCDQFGIFACAICKFPCSIPGVGPDQGATVQARCMGTVGLHYRRDNVVRRWPGRSLWSFAIVGARKDYIDGLSLLLFLSEP